MAITVRIDDPATIALLQRYSTFLAVEDQCVGTLDQVVDGLIVGFLDEHGRFADWDAKAAAVVEFTSGAN